MKYQRKQTVGNIQFIVESIFKKNNGVSAKEMLSKIMVNKAKEAISTVNKLKTPIVRN